MKRTTEAAFETVIEAHLLENGYVLFVIAERTRRAERVAGAIYMAGVVTDEKDERYSRCQCQSTGCSTCPSPNCSASHAGTGQGPARHLAHYRSSCFSRSLRYSP